LTTIGELISIDKNDFKDRIANTAIKKN